MEKNCNIVGCSKCIKSHNPEHQKYKIISDYLLSKYTFLQRLGEGGSSTVFKVFSQFKKLEIALKIIYVQEMFDELEGEFGFEELKKYLQNEIVLHRQLNHDNIIKYYDSVWIEKEKIILIELEIGENTLSYYMTDLKENDAEQMFYDICCAVQFLHKNDIIHRDLKPGNNLIKISEENEKIVKLADFGGAKLQTLYGSRKKNTLHGGTRAYLAPEKLANSDSDFTESTDVWALGVIYHQMLTGGINPFPTKNDILKYTPKFSPKIKSSKMQIIKSKQNIFFLIFFFFIRMFNL